MTRGLLKILWMLIGWLELILLTVLLYGLSLLPLVWGRRFYRQLFRLWCRTFVHALGVDLRLHQHLTHALPQRYLLIANHPSAFEDIGIPALFEVDCLAKAEVRNWWIAGRISAAAGTLFVKREDKASRGAAAMAIEQALKEGRNIALYPEGGVMGIRIHDSFRHGVFDISLRSGVPIVPVFIHYESQWDFHWHPHQNLIQKIWHFMSTTNNRANYHLYDAIDPAGFSDKETYSESVRARYLAWQKQYMD